jgi:two-component system nitrate/nitrite sensor histidine kinase NarX
MHLGAVFGDDPRLWSEEQTIRVGECICGEAAAGLLPVAVDDTSNDPRISGRTCGAGGVVSVPLKASGGSLGVLSIWSYDPHHFALQDIELLTAIASFLAAAIENAHIRSEMKERIAELSTEVQQLTIVEERERIGREMHDGLAQTLGLLNLQIELVKEAVGAADWAAAQDELTKMDVYLAEAYNDVREALGNLRSTEPQGEAFVPALQEYVREFGRRNGLEAVLVTENGQGPICLPALVEVQLQRVIHEALTNVRRHAAAGRVEVRVRGRGEGWEVTVADDGVGFDPLASRRAGKGGYGLSTMRERVESLGGRFSIASQPGEGTQVAVFVPCDAGN